MRENKAAVQDMAGPCLTIMEEASKCLTILDPETGDAELIKSVADEKAQLRSGTPGRPNSAIRCTVPGVLS